MTKLFTVRIEFDYVVVAENEMDAEAVGRGYIKEALSDMSVHDVDIFVSEGATAWGWDDDCIPYGGDGNTRTGEYLNGKN